MADNVKLLRANVTILAAYPEAFADPLKPKAAELNNQFVYDTNEDGMVFNVSCSILDDYDINMGEPDTDDTMTVCDVANVEDPTFDNYTVQFDTLRDKDVDAKGIFNMSYELFGGADRPFLFYKRIGKANTAPFLTDGSDIVSIFGTNTDNPVDIVEDNTMLQFGPRFKNTGVLEINYEVVS